MQVEMSEYHELLRQIGYLEATVKELEQMSEIYKERIAELEGKEAGE